MTRLKPIWRAGVDGTAHALATFRDRRYACGARVLDERFAWPATSRCTVCVVALAAEGRAA